MVPLAEKILDVRVIAALIAAIALVIGAILTFLLNKRLEMNKVRLDMKRKVLLDALNLTDAILSHQSEFSKTAKTDFSMKEIRECYNNLAVVVKDKKLLYKFKVAWGYGDYEEEVDFSIISELRNMVRKELGFGKKEIDIDKGKAFLNYIPNSKPPKENIE
ncbi:hypothetical protein [Paenibacillus terrae]|uniref:Uncharacterized protein n=1 Tax=Paenibacillus terrae TaxID=159743 RepID=A0A0D7X9C4_9BACL|nr:hypothetical protein [Paenibacillus terrae]KJD46702.1 hypothetical protein QD47_05465 [Paenibacillus terrae]